MIVITINEKYKDKETIEKVIKHVSYFDTGDWVYEQAIAGYEGFTKEGNVVLVKFNDTDHDSARGRVVTKEDTLCIHIVGKLIYVKDKYKSVDKVLDWGGLREFLILNIHLYKDAGVVSVKQDLPF